jgi:hypothetical protein
VLLAQQGLTADAFTEHRDIYEFVSDYYTRFRVAPTTGVIKARFSGWAPPDGEFEFWATALHEHNIARRAQQAIRTSLERMDKPTEALQELITSLSAIRVGGSNNIVASDRGAPEAYQKYLARQEIYNASGGTHVFGIKTGFECFNATHVGYLPGELIAFIARSSVGKSWILANEAANAWMQGYRVLYVSPEMPAHQFELRIYAILAYKFGLRFSHQAAYEGNPLVQESFAKLAAELAKSERWWTVDSIDGKEAGLADIRTLNAQFAPDIIFVDGIALLRNETKARAVFEMMRYNAYGLKTLATAASVPIIVAAQTVVEKARGRDDESKTKFAAVRSRGEDYRLPRGSDIADGADLYRACNLVIGLAPDPEREDVLWYSVLKTRERPPIPEDRMAVRWNVDAGRIDDLGHLSENQKAMLEALRT